jgi:hypothetical protein
MHRRVIEAFGDFHTLPFRINLNLEALFCYQAAEFTDEAFVSLRFLLQQAI